MITRLLDDLGLFVGNRVESNQEATLFLRLNRWLLRIGGGRWDNPEPFQYLLDSPQDRDLARDYLDYILSSPTAAEFLGWKEYLKTVAGNGLAGPWGWKDPRNTFTVPLWLEVFPNAKLLYIERHVVDVARSLRERRKRKFHQTRDRYRKLREAFRHVYWLRDKQSGFGGSVRCSSLQGGFSLWRQYVDQGRRLAEEYPSRTMQIQYEEMLETPVSELERIADFCELSISNTELECAAEQVDASRAFAFESSHELLEFSAEVSEVLGQYDYRS
jgi:hypothetical protein